MNKTANKTIKKEGEGKTSGIVGLKDLRENMEKYIGHIKKGRSFTVVRRSRPIFKVVPVDEWGDGGEWETIADFRDMPNGGIPADDLIELLKKKQK